MGIELERFLNQLLIKAEQAIKESISPRNMKILGDETIFMMQRRIISGRGVETNDSTEFQLKPLASRTITIRKILSKDGKLSNKTSPTKSNVIRTGQFIDSFASSSSSFGTGSIYLSGSRNDNKSNQYVNNELEKGGRTVFRVSTKEIDTVAFLYNLHLVKNFGIMINSIK